MDKDYRRSAALVRPLLERLNLTLSEQDIWFPNVGSESGADVGVTLPNGRHVGIQLTEIDPFSVPGERGRERKKKLLANGGVYGNFAQNDLAAIVDAIFRAIERKTRITPDQNMFSEVWLLLCLGVPDFPTSTFAPTAWLSPTALASTTERLFNSRYAECFLLSFCSTENALYRWSRRGDQEWRKSVYLEDVSFGTSDAEYVRELLRTGGKDKSVIDAQVQRVLAEIRGLN